MGKYRRWALEIFLWIVALFLAYVFAKQGLAKFSDTSGWAKAFRVWHFPDWFRMTVGGMEIAAALLLLTRRTASAGAMIIIIVMMGAMGTHIWWHNPGQVRSEIFPLALATIVAWGRRRELLARRQAEPAA